jgi:sterol desaturase/sphingolipid hydroxylase (fatty acid hydroxylase superfamily)
LLRPPLRCPCWSCRVVAAIWLLRLHLSIVASIRLLHGSYRRHLDASTALRFHPFDMACYVAIIAGTLVGLGIPLWVAGLRAVALNPLLMAQHANVNFPPAVERWLSWLFVTPAFHRVHHSADAPGIDANYGQMFSIWDRLFGSYVVPAAADPPRIGVHGFGGDEWQSVGGMLMTPWRGRDALRVR